MRGGSSLLFRLISAAFAAAVPPVDANSPKIPCFGNLCQSPGDGDAKNCYISVKTGAIRGQAHTCSSVVLILTCFPKFLIFPPVRLKRDL